jgi:hypothetical protein
MPVAAIIARSDHGARRRGVGIVLQREQQQFAHLGHDSNHPAIEPMVSSKRIFLR